MDKLVYAKQPSLSFGQLTSHPCKSPSAIRIIFVYTGNSTLGRENNRLHPLMQTRRATPNHKALPSWAPTTKRKYYLHQDQQSISRTQTIREERNTSEDKSMSNRCTQILHPPCRAKNIRLATKVRKSTVILTKSEKTNKNYNFYNLYLHILLI